MALLDGGIANTMARALGGIYLPARVIAADAPEYDDGGSIIEGDDPCQRPCRAQVDAVTETMRRAEGFTERDQRILVLAGTLKGDITTDNRIEILAGPHCGMWMIESVGRDPAGAYHELRGRRA